MTTQSHCRDLGSVLSAYVDHEATPEEMALVEAHARTCSGCAAQLERYQALTPRVDADVRALLFEADSAARRRGFRGPPEPMRPRGEHRRVRLGGQPPVQLLSRRATLALVVAVIVFVFVGVLLVRSAPARTAGVETPAQPSPPSALKTPNRPPVLVASIDGVVDPAVAAYVHRAVSAAEDQHGSALVVVLDASGGVAGPLQQVAQDLATSSVPTLAFIVPGRTDAVDSWLARSSRLAAPPNTPSLDAFLRTVDENAAQTPGAVALIGAPIETLDMDPLEALAHRLMDPTTAYLLFVLGLYAAVIELAHPGALVPGATALVCLALASVSLAMLPTNWLGVAVLVAAVGLMALELKAATHGALVLAGVVGLVAGSVLLYSTPGSLLPTQAEVSVAPWVLVGAAGTGLVVGLLLARIARRIHDLPPILSLDQLIGARGLSRGGLDPEGVVQVGGQLWSARLRGGRLEPGQPIRVIARHGLVLEVESAALGAATRKGTPS